MALGAGLVLQLQPFSSTVRLVELAANAAGKLGARWGGRRGSLWGGLSACGDDGGGGECGFLFLR